MAVVVVLLRPFVHTRLVVIAFELASDVRPSSVTAVPIHPILLLSTTIVHHRTLKGSKVKLKNLMRFMCVHNNPLRKNNNNFALENPSKFWHRHRRANSTESQIESSVHKHLAACERLLCCVLCVCFFTRSYQSQSAISAKRFRLHLLLLLLFGSS